MTIAASLTHIYPRKPPEFVAPRGERSGARDSEVGTRGLPQLPLSILEHGYLRQYADESQLAPAYHGMGVG